MDGDCVQTFMVALVEKYGLGRKLLQKWILSTFGMRTAIVRCWQTVKKEGLATTESMNPLDLIANAPFRVLLVLT